METLNKYAPLISLVLTVVLFFVYLEIDKKKAKKTCNCTEQPATE